MFTHSFFKNSFIILLAIDLSYGLALTMLSNNPVNIDTLYIALIWFVAFYWLPVWGAAVIIYIMRTKGLHYTALEWLIVVVLMTFGNALTDQTLLMFYQWHTPMGSFVIFNGILWGSGIYFVTRYFEGNQKFQMEENARKQAQLATLRYQLNPHFMFNSLNTISAYIHSKPDLADEVLHELADILRYSLDTAELESISLQHELDIINKYIKIEKVRFGERLTVDFNIPDKIHNIHIPPLILQPVIENAVKHNANQKSLHLVININVIDALLKIVIKDNGSGFSQQILDKGYGTGIGMKNLQQRVAQLKNGRMQISNDLGAVIQLEMAL
jgi:two-component system LytT family sensor kinase